MRRVLIVGAGSIGERHVRCFQYSGQADVVVCDTNADVRTRIESKYAACQTYSDFDDALDVKPEAVVIATPAHLHIPMALIWPSTLARTSRAVASVSASARMPSTPMNTGWPMLVPGRSPWCGFP